MKWSWRLGRVGGIDLFVHWTFVLLIGWIMVAHVAAGHGVAAAVQGGAFVLAVFGCVVLHEFGHAIAAKRYGIGTIDITLLPIGGVARLERMPETPKQELCVALAGPAVNVLIAAVLFGAISLLNGVSSPFDVRVVGGHSLANLMWVNLVLVGFNMLPAFPMDGGRVLRALLAWRMGHVRATRMAAEVGKAAALMLGVLGIFANWMLVFIAIFIFVEADRELRMVEMRAVLRDADAGSAMVTRFRVLQQDDTLDRAACELLAWSQPDFPVVDQGQRLVGVLPRGHLFKALAETGPDEPVVSAMQRDCEIVEDSEPLETTYERLHEDGCSSLPVVHDGRLVGIVTMDSISDWVMVRAACGNNGAARRTKSLMEV
jgi:Zn-dependent protease